MCCMSEPVNSEPAPTEPVAPGYEILEVIAQSGMGAVYRARDLQLEHDVAIKVLQSGVDPKPLLREAQIIARLQHPGIVPVYSLGTLPDGCPFMAMKLIHGRTLAGVLRECVTPHDRPRLIAV